MRSWPTWRCWDSGTFTSSTWTRSTFQTSIDNSCSGAHTPSLFLLPQISPTDSVPHISQNERCRSAESDGSGRIHHAARSWSGRYAVRISLALYSCRELDADSMYTLDRYHGKIQDKDDDYYMQFNIVVCGLDSVDARRWMSATLVNLVDPEVPESLKPMIDGGTEGSSRILADFISDSKLTSMSLL